MKTSSIALFLALSAGYLGVASADTLQHKIPKTDKEAAVASPNPDDKNPHHSNDSRQD